MKTCVCCGEPLEWWHTLELCLRCKRAADAVEKALEPNGVAFWDIKNGWRGGPKAIEEIKSGMPSYRIDGYLGEDEK